MNSRFAQLLICSTFSMTLLAACGPETNSRYGDEHWDPQSTWENAQVIEQPELRIVYNDTDPAEDNEVWEGYVSVDFSDLALRDEGGENTALLSYSVGTNEPLAIPNAMLQNNAGAEWSQFYYDTTTDTDWRLHLTEPEVYTFYLDLAVRQPNGTLRVYNFSWSDIILPGPITRDVYWDNRINALITENCISCHGQGGSDAQGAFNLSNNIRNNFVSKARNPTADKALPDYPFSSEHTGSGNAANITGGARADFMEFTNAVIDHSDGNDFEMSVIDPPSIMENDPYN